MAGAFPGLPPRACSRNRDAVRIGEVILSPGLTLWQATGQTLHVVTSNGVGTVPCAHPTDEKTEAHMGCSDLPGSAVRKWG